MESAKADRQSKLVVCAGRILSITHPGGVSRRYSDEELKNAEILPDEFLERVSQVFPDLDVAREWPNAQGPANQGRTPLECALCGDFHAVYRELAFLKSAPSDKSRDSQAHPPDDASNFERNAASGRIRGKLQEYEAMFGRDRNRVQVNVLLTRELDHSIEALRHQNKVPKATFLGAAAGLFIRDFEKLYGCQVPVDPFRLVALSANNAELIMTNLINFRKSMDYEYSPMVSSYIPSVLDTKMGHIVYLLHSMLIRLVDKLEI
jgi:hypothetical protein